MATYVFWRVYVSENFKAVVFSPKDILIYVQIKKKGLNQYIPARNSRLLSGLSRDNLYCLSSTRNGPMCMEASKKFGLIGNNLFPSNEKTGKKVGLLPNRRFIRFIWSLSAENLQILCARCGKTTGPTTLLHIPRVHICSEDFKYTWHCFEAVTVSE